MQEQEKKEFTVKSNVQKKFIGCKIPRAQKEPKTHRTDVRGVKGLERGGKQPTRSCQ